MYMNKARVLRRLRSRRGELKALGVRSLYLFGSTARGAARPASDIDLFIEYDKGRFDLFDLAGVQAMLAEQFPVAVDVTTRGSLHPRLRGNIEREAVKVF
jgi:predicted nucleotidyltransferase